MVIVLECFRMAYFQRENGEKDMSKINPGVLFDACCSWNGYNHQGKLALFYAVQEITSLIHNDPSDTEDREKLKSYFLEIEYMEDFAVGKLDEEGNAEYISVHQVKDRKDTALSVYKSAIQGLAKHLIDEPSIKAAYLHVTRSLTLQKDFGEYVSEMVTDTQWIAEHEKKIKSEEESVDKSEFLAVLAEMRSQFQAFPERQIEKIALYSYCIEGQKQNYCAEDQVSGLLKEILASFYRENFCGTDKTSEKFINKSYLYMMGKLDQHIVERSLNYDAYKSEKKDRRIHFSRIYDWLVSDEIGANGEDFYLYHIKERYFQLADNYCERCRDRVGGCRYDCQIPVFKDKLGTLSFSAIKTFLYRTNPSVIRKMDIDNYHLFLQESKIKKPFLKGLHNISEKITEEVIFDAVSYFGQDNNQYALTMIARDDSDDEDEDVEICTNIARNEEAYPLLMDYDCLISRDVVVQSIFSSNLSVAQDDSGRHGENIFHPKNVGIMTLDQFLELNQEGR